MTRESAEMPEFGVELRRLREAAGLSIAGLAKLIRFSKGHISKVETGQQPSPSSQFARMADAALEAGGRLIALGPSPSDPQSSPRQTEVQHVSIPTPQPKTAAVDKASATHTLETFEKILKELRGLGQTMDPATVADMTKPHIAALQDLATRLDGSLAIEALRLAAHFAEFTSWMTQEAGDDRTALRWISLSENLANEIDDRDLVANTYMRRSNLALYQQDGYGTVKYAKKALEEACGSRQMFLAVLREAQGYALLGDHERFRATIDRADTLRAQGGDERPEPQFVARSSIGPTKITDPFALAKGWSLHDLGRNAEAIEILEPLLAKTTREDNRAWARIACRLALALASAREVDRACGLTKDILSLTTVARSATIRSDLRLLSATLRRWYSDESVREIMPLLSAALLPAVEESPSPPLAPGR